ncbi:MAG: NAD(P)H-dependent oxidoreductase [Planctomycetes bacterium]|nr:NAD(P)H-dependent oxidoreductase [Planctomycetota bacterium]
MTTKILAFAGSLRRDSFNKKLVQIAASGARAAGAEVTYVDLREFAMPLYDGDLEAADGVPENAKRFKALMKSHQAFLIASPEYNSSISGVLKNTLDWASRAEPGEAPLACFKGKVAGIMSASPGALGGLRGLVTVRSILGNLHVIVLPEQIAVSKAHEALADETRLHDAKQQAAIEALAARVVQVTAALQAAR